MCTEHAHACTLYVRRLIPMGTMDVHNLQRRRTSRFWGVATTSVLLGQLYVGTGYRAYANALLRIFDSIEVEIGRDYRSEGYY